MMLLLLPQLNITPKGHLKGLEKSVGIQEKLFLGCVDVMFPKAVDSIH